ncbi:predicted protein [Naegleria gruberi]|uniref:Predicted protein n=1 Tax=Naegleria gruberi TaxID=5762 RepID=D2W0X4_NAEGR|nr:uncharacterized protein NAEGRDRAFT_59792 [Naegleria gruberi]EFC37256.1 predicted protein [Naegleria gruberi]|eukprot:XP_002670000.1 predicted protein [Naegleria gruberi strain NEG-M]
MANNQRTLTLIPYGEARNEWPDDGNHIIASYTEDAVLVYQAFNDEIADYAVKHQKFDGCPSYNDTRMTWVKSNWLWMMYRSNYATKQNQTRILGLWLKKSAYDDILKKARLKGAGAGLTRAQWDPDYSPELEPIKRRRDLQLGIKKRETFRNGEDFVEIVDCTELAHISKKTKTIPHERVYTPDNEVCINLQVSKLC